MLKSIRKENDGFTLVEMIVVIVILSILLAILIPGLISFIDKAKDKQIEAVSYTHLDVYKRQILYG